MIGIDGRPFGNCAGMTRRRLLQAGFLGLSGLTLGDWMKARAASSARPDADRTSVILVWLDGGPPQHETYDPKPDAPAEFRGPLKAIDTKIPGMQISELLPEHARIADRLALIRSMHHNNGDHFAAAHWMLTGYHGSNAVNMAPQYPSAGSVVARLKGSKAPGVPAYVGLPHTHSVGLSPGYHGAAYLGSAYNPFNADGDPNNPNFRVNNLHLPQGLTVDQLNDRRTLLASFDQTRQSADANGVDVDPFRRAAFELLTGPAARAAFDLHAESPHLRDRYGRHQWGQSALLARRLVEAGVRFVTLTFGGWDFHTNLEKGMHNVLPVLDRAVATLIDDLDQRGLLDTTLVLVMGEFGRTPKISKLGDDPNPGRDHWGQVMSVLAAGAGIVGGRAVGSSNARGEVPKELPLTPADLVATIYDRLGLDLETTFYDRVNRPIPITPHGGRVIQELF